MRKRVQGLIMGAVVGVLIAGGIAWAAIPDSTNGTITACYPTSGTSKGSLRVVDYQAGERCKTGEARLTWPSRGFRWRGAWSGSLAYSVNDVVRFNGSAFIATAANTNTPPSAANISYWNLVAAAGATGPQGATGATGPQGPPAPTPTQRLITYASNLSIGLGQTAGPAIVDVSDCQRISILIESVAPSTLTLGLYSAPGTTTNIVGSLASATIAPGSQGNSWDPGVPPVPAVHLTIANNGPANPVELSNVWINCTTFSVARVQTITLPETNVPLAVGQTSTYAPVDVSGCENLIVFAAETTPSNLGFSLLPSSSPAGPPLGVLAAGSGALGGSGRVYFPSASPVPAMRLAIRNDGGFGDVVMANAWIGCQTFGG